MKSVLLLPFITALLCGCPDAKVPKAPPKVPEPKASAMAPSDIPAALTNFTASTSFSSLESREGTG